MASFAELISISNPLHNVSFCKVEGELVQEAHRLAIAARENM